MRQSINKHEGRKYIRTIMPCEVISDGIEGAHGIEVDVYCVLKAFPTNCPATDHAIKKLLCAGERGKGNRIADLKGAMAALNRAMDMEEQTVQKKDARDTAFAVSEDTAREQWPPKNQEVSKLEKCIEVLRNYNIGWDGQEAIHCLEKEILPALKKLKEGQT